MPENNFVYRIHPAIGLARVGNSNEYLISPETMAGLPIEGTDKFKGGLPTRPEDDQTITSKDLRDKAGALKRQAARFRIYQYKKEAPETYPNGGGTEVTIGTQLEDGRKVVDIIWTVHIANKKANGYVLENPELLPNELIIEGYVDGNLPPLRNAFVGPDTNNAARVRMLTIDPGPRSICGPESDAKRFDKKTLASYWDGESKSIENLPNYPKSFPDDSFAKLFCPSTSPENDGSIDTLGELRTDKHGRLLVIPGYGRTCSWYQADGTPFPLEEAVDNDGWFDDVGDGPVDAILKLKDDDDNITYQTVHGAWVVSTDPSYAPQVMNVVTLWDDMYDTWVRKLQLQPEIFTNRYQDDFRPDFNLHLLPFFTSAALQRWATNLPEIGIKAHEAVGKIQASDAPDDTILGGLAYIRNPNNVGENDVGAPLMPLSLGDQGRAFLSPTLTQYFFLEQWSTCKYETESDVKLGTGEALDRAILVNCLGGRFSPGIDMTFIIREPELYIQDWQTSGSGPFRIKSKPRDYRNLQPSQPFLTGGYIPLRNGEEGLEPGDASKFMSAPWHTDYNSCGTHETAPNPLNSSTLYWSWPAQRPVAVYAAKDVKYDKLGHQRYSVRAKGTETDNPAQQGRFQQYLDFVYHWWRVGVVIQGNRVDAVDSGFQLDDKTKELWKQWYLEVQSLLDIPEVQPWPINAKD